MTNTRITDPEIFERRYPIVLRTFTLRPGSGGEGMFRGGDGVIREIEVRKPLLVSILSERRAFQPYGLEGGGVGARGTNTVIRIDGRKLNLGGKNTIAMVPGERLRIETPGGGGFGDAAAAAAGAAGAASGFIEGTSGSGAAFLFSGSVGRYKETQESV